MKMGALSMKVETGMHFNKYLAVSLKKRLEEKWPEHVRHTVNFTHSPMNMSVRLMCQTCNKLLCVLSYEDLVEEKR